MTALVPNLRAFHHGHQRAEPLVGDQPLDGFDHHCSIRT